MTGAMGSRRSLHFALATALFGAVWGLACTLSPQPLPPGASFGTTPSMPADGGVDLQPAPPSSDAGAPVRSDAGPLGASDGGGASDAADAQDAGDAGNAPISDAASDAADGGG